MPIHPRNAQAPAFPFGITQTETPDLTDSSPSPGRNTPFSSTSWLEPSEFSFCRKTNLADRPAPPGKRRRTNLKRHSTSALSPDGSPPTAEDIKCSARATSSESRTEQRPTCLWMSHGDGDAEGARPCMQSFDSAAELHEHIKKDHTSQLQRSYSCRWSGCVRFDNVNDFKQRSKLERHMVTHSGRKLFPLVRVRKETLRLHTIASYLLARSCQTEGGRHFCTRKFLLI